MAMTEPVKGIIHVHSDFSRDGLSSVDNLADFAREAGFQFVGLTDHAEDLSLEDRQCLRRECEDHSDDSCVMIPGLEFRCDNDIHILGLGISGDIPSSDPVIVTIQIRTMGGLAVLAHPGRNGYQFPPELFGVLDGIEIWNAGYDGRFIPPMANLRLLQEARGPNPAIVGFGGADLHWLNRPPGVVLELGVNGTAAVDKGVVLQHLRSGRFSICGRYITFDANTGPHGLARFPLWTFRKLYEVSRGIRDAALKRT